MSTGISLCMIVRNEEARIERAITSALPWVDEVIICDTGSNDRTLDIIRDLQTKVIPFVVFEEPWRSDFSYHRNQVASRASNDWILVLDGDEELVGDGSHLRRAISEPGADAVSLPVELVADGGTTYIESPRLYRRSVASYQYPVHNQLMGFRHIARVIGQPSVRSYYTGTQQAKLDRSIPMLERMLADSQAAGDQTGIFAALYYLAKSHFIGQNPVKVLEYTDQIPWDLMAANVHAIDVLEWAVYSTLAVRGSVVAEALVDRAVHQWPAVPLVWKLRLVLDAVRWYVTSQRDQGLSFSQRDATLEGMRVPVEVLRSLRAPIDLTTLRVVEGG